MGWGVLTSMILEYVTDGVGCGNVNDLEADATSICKWKDAKFSHNIY